jgi:endonuclease/exonuclease/phosphatase family metal-dependent hydrolase
MSPPAPAPAGDGDGSLTVMTWNVWWRFGQWERRRDALLAVLRRERPDVLALQEVWGQGEENLAADLAGELGMQWTWVASPSPDRWRRRLGNHDLDFGNAVLSRWPMADRAELHLPCDDGADDGRTALHVRVRTPSADVPFFTTHLSSAPYQGALRLTQVERLAAFVAGHSPRRGFPPVVAGDFNAVPQSDEMRRLGGYLTAGPVPGLILLDAWEYADPADPGLTWDRRNPHVAPVRMPSARIDHVLVGLPRPGGAGYVLEARLAGDRPEGGVWPSDHAAVLVRLSLPPVPDGTGPGPREA